MGLPADYPMVAPNYAVARSQLAKKMGLGQQRRAAEITRVIFYWERQAAGLQRSAIVRGLATANCQAAASASRASERMRSTMARKPLDAGGVQMFAESEFVEHRKGVGFARISLRRMAEYSVSRIAIRPRTDMGVGCRRDSSATGSLAALAVEPPCEPTWLAQPCTLLARNARPPHGIQRAASSMTYTIAVRPNRPAAQNYP